MGVHLDENRGVGMVVRMAVNNGEHMFNHFCKYIYVKLHEHIGLNMGEHCCKRSSTQGCKYGCKTLE